MVNTPAKRKMILQLESRKLYYTYTFGSIYIDLHQYLYILTLLETTCLFQRYLEFKDIHVRISINTGFMHLFHHSSSPPHYDWSGLGYIQAVCLSAAWYKWIPGRSSHRLSHNHTVHTQHGELKAQGATTPKPLCGRLVLFNSAPDQPDGSSPGNRAKSTKRSLSYLEIVSRACA